MSEPAALVRVAWTPGRSEPSHRSELVTQWLCGERLDVEEEGEDGWLRVRGPDGYASWVDEGGLLRVETADADRWEEVADRISLGTDLRPPGSGRGGIPPSDVPADANDAAAGAPRFLPWGARVAPPEAGRGAADHEGRVRLPDGAIAEAADRDRLVAREELVLRFPPRADALLATAASWSGVPYVWGGRTREGVDCSGYVQAVLALHGRPLPRDSGQQATADDPVWTAPSSGEESGEDEVDALAVARDVLRRGDLLFFGAGGDGGAVDDGERAITHVALAAGDTEILHAAAGRGQVRRDDLMGDDPLMERIRGRLAVVTRPVAREAGGRR